MSASFVVVGAPRSWTLVISGTGVFLVAGAGAVGWLSDLIGLATMIPGTIPMAPNTALAFLILAAVLLFARHAVLVRRVSACLVGLLASLTLASDALGIDVDRWFVASKGSYGTFQLGVMSPMTAAIFLIAAVAMALAPPASRRLRELVIALGAAVAAAGLLFVLGYAHAKPFLYDTSIIPLAFSTALAFFLLGVGIVADTGLNGSYFERFLEDTVKARLLRALVPVVVVVALARDLLLTQLPWNSTSLANPALANAALVLMSLVVVALLIGRIAKALSVELEGAEHARAQVAIKTAQADALRQQRDELLRLQQRNRELSALIVHDLKSPLTSIIANVHYAREDPSVTAEVKESLRDVGDAAASMHRMVLNLLDISRGDDQRLQPQLREIDLGDLVRDVCNLMGQRATDLESSLLREVTEEPIPVRADPDLIRRVLENLVDNSLKFSAGGDIHVEAMMEEGSAVLRVCDHGPGIPPEQREHIFQKYARVEGKKTGRGSHGLGLLFCRLAVESHGGHISVDAHKPTGACFSVHLPVATDR